MKLNSTLVAAAATLVLAASGAAVAATNAPKAAATKATCDSLEKQANTAIDAHKYASAIGEAKKQREMGTKECGAGNFDKGAEHLRKSLTDLGMKPVD